jgi:uncharacterized protein
MRALIKLFGRSPFAPLRTHMEKVADCVHHLPKLFKALESGDQEEVLQISKKISKLEHDADLSKNDIRLSLKSHLFLPVDRVSLLEVLALQDSLADKAEDIGVLLTFHKLEMPKFLSEEFGAFVRRNIEAFDQVFAVMGELNELLESSFGGSEAEKLRSMVDQVAYTEHEIDLMQRELLRTLFDHEQELTHGNFILWLKVIEEVGGLSNLAEKLGNRVLLTMELR